MLNDRYIPIFQEQFLSNIQVRFCPILNQHPRVRINIAIIFRYNFISSTIKSISHYDKVQLLNNMFTSCGLQCLKHRLSPGPPSGLYSILLIPKRRKYKFRESKHHTLLITLEQPLRKIPSHICTKPGKKSSSVSADEPLLCDLLAFLVGGAKDDMLQNEGLGKTNDVVQKDVNALH